MKRHVYLIKFNRIQDGGPDLAWQKDIFAPVNLLGAFSQLTLGLNTLGKRKRAARSGQLVLVRFW